MGDATTDAEGPPSGMNEQPLPPAPWVTRFIAAANAGVYVLMCLRGVSPFDPTGKDLLAWGADFGPREAGRGVRGPG